MDGKLRNMASVYLYDENNKILMLYRIGSRAIKDSYIGTAGGHFEKDEFNEKIYGGIAVKDGVEFFELENFE